MLFLILLSCCFLFGQAPFVNSISEINRTNGRWKVTKVLCVFFSLQDVVNVMGGIGVLLPLLEQVCEAEQVYNGGQEISDLLGPELTSPRGPAAMLLPLNKSAGQVMFRYSEYDFFFFFLLMQ